MKIEKMLEERQKSSNQRELEKYMKDQREIQIKNELDKIHKKQTKENWKGSNLLKSDTFFNQMFPFDRKFSSD